MAAEGRRGRARARIAADVAMAVLCVAVMATALVQEAPHEYLGVALLVATVAHVVLNQRWFKVLLRGRYGVVRTIQLIAVVGLLVCILGQAASSLVLSKHAFGFLPALPGTGWARRVHMLCSYWSFVFAFAHAGLQLKGFGRLVRTRGETPAAAVWAARVVVVAASCYGVYAFFHMNIGAYLLGQVQFACADYSVPVAILFARYAAIAVLVTSAFHYLSRIVSRNANGRVGQEAEKR